MSEDAWTYPEDNRTQAEREADHQSWRAQRQAAEDTARLTARRESDLRPTWRKAKSAVDSIGEWF